MIFAVNLAEEFQSGAEVMLSGIVLAALLPDLSQRVMQFTSDLRLLLEFMIDSFFGAPDRVNQFDIGADAMSRPAVDRVTVGKRIAQEFIDAARLVTLTLRNRGLPPCHSRLPNGLNGHNHKQ